MRRPDFDQLASELLRAGVSPRHVRRTVVELSDHFDDLVDDALEQGIDVHTAEAKALRDLGEFPDLVMAVRERPELRSWAYRFPHVALVIYPLTCLALLPALPIFAGVAHAPQLARWAMSILLSGLVTAAIFLILQLSIVLT